MAGNIIGFSIWIMIGCFFICLGVYSIFVRKPMRFWANTDVFEVTDIKKYNYAIAKLFCIYGIAFLLLGLPLLSGQNSAWILISILGLMVESIMAMAVYSLIIEKKYRKK